MKDLERAYPLTFRTRGEWKEEVTHHLDVVFVGGPVTTPTTNPSF